MLHDFRIWDYRTANSVDHFLSNSKYIKRRIKKVYRRDAQVIYPPVDIDRFKFKAEKSEFFLTASRMVPYKKMDLIAEAFSKMPGNQLIIIGDGPEMEKIKAIAARSANIKLLGFQANEILVDHMQRAKAFIFAAEEDFGIIPVEAQACGTPVIAFGAGGALETILDAEKHHNGTGIFFQEQTALDIQRAVERFEKMNILPLNCRNNAENFAPANFQYQFKQFVDNALQEHKAERI
jgi:glycosyltransferase involved in cell wall biosynthesis